MDLDEYRRRMADMASSVERTAGEIVRDETERLAGDIKNRIARTGKGTNGTKLKSYSTRPQYFPKSKFDKKSAFSPRGKDGKRNHKNGRRRKSMYLKRGYKELRDIQGKPTNITNLIYRGNLMNSFTASLGENEVVIGFTNSEASRKRKDLSSYYDTPIFYASKREIEKFSERLIDKHKLRVNVRDD